MIKRWFGALFACCLLLLSGCGAGSGATKQAQTLRAANEAGILLRGNGPELESLDPHLATFVSSANVVMALFEGLVREDPTTLAPVPGIAERWEISEDGRVYTFFLRDAQWSNGDPVTAQDFIQSWTRMLHPALGATYAYMLYPLKGAKAHHETGEGQLGAVALDTKTLQVTLESPVPFFLSLLNHWTWFPVHTQSLLQHAALHDRDSRWTLPGNLVSNGPFVLNAWKVNAEVSVTKNTRYWDAEAVTLNEVRFLTFSDEGAEERAFRMGELHMTFRLPPVRLGWYREHQPESLRIDPYLETVYYALNQTRGPLKEPKVRQALSLALNRKQISQRILQGGKAPAYAFVPPGTAGFVSQTQLGEDAERARTLLAEAGFPAGEGFPELTLIFSGGDEVKKVAELVQQQWVQRLGIRIELSSLERKLYLQRRGAGEFDLCYMGWVGDYIDPDTFLGLWQSGAGNNIAGYDSEAYDVLLHRAAGEAASARMATLAEAEAQLLEDLPILPLYFGTTKYLVHRSVQGWYPTLLDHHPLRAVHLAPLETDPSSL